MGSALIIRGANFINNIGTEYDLTLLPDNTTINIATTNDAYGTNFVITANNRLAVKENVFIPNGSSIILGGLKGKDGLKSPLRVDYCVWNKDERITDNVITTGSKGVSADYFPLNKIGENSVVITNDTGEDGYFGICFSGLTKTEKIYRDDYAIFYTT